MQRIKIHKRKLLILSLVIIFLQMLVFSVLWNIPYIKELMLEYNTHPAIKSYDFIGGEQNWKLARMLFHIGFILGSIYIYTRLYSALPKGILSKGLFFGAVIGFFRFIPEAFNTWTLVDYPETLILIRLLLGVSSFVLFGLIVSILLDKGNAIERIPNNE